MKSEYSQEIADEDVYQFIGKIVLSFEEHSLKDRFPGI